MKHLLTLLFISWFLPLTLSAQSRHALLMGVGDYQGARYQDAVIADLPGITTADLPNMAAKLRSLGFTVDVVDNPNLSQARTAVEAYKARLSRATRESGGPVALFYFSGHGVEYQGQHYLIPSAAYMPSKADVEHTALNTQSVVNSMEESGATVCLSFLDCCRQDLGKNVGGADKTPLQAKGSFIGFATRSGGIADPGVTGSPFTRFLLQHLDTPGLSVADMYSQVISDVKAHALKNYGEDRRPGFYSELDAPFYFVPTSYRKEADMQAEIERRAREMAAKMVPGAASTATPEVRPAPHTPANPVDQVGIGKVFQTMLPGNVPLIFRYCPPGSFTMGSPLSEKDRSDHETQVQVRISQGFWMGQTELTQAQWKALMGTTPNQQKASGVAFGDVNGLGNDHPMYFVSWHDAQAFITKLNQTAPPPAGWQYALPTEAQWEYACRAGTESVFHFGDALNGEQANMNGNYPYGMSTKGPFLEKTCPVGSYPANAWGLHDMHGNVWEWCADWYAEKRVGGLNPPGAGQGVRRVNRGGSWYNAAAGCRAAIRLGSEPGFRYSYLGFRPALVPSNQ